MLLVQTSTRANTAKSSPSIQTILKLDAIQCNPMQLSVTQKATQSTANINALHSSNILLNAHNIIFHKEGFYPNCLRLPEHLRLDVLNMIQCVRLDFQTITLLCMVCGFPRAVAFYALLRRKIANKTTSEM